MNTNTTPIVYDIEVTSTLSRHTYRALTPAGKEALGGENHVTIREDYFPLQFDNKELRIDTSRVW